MTYIPLLESFRNTDQVGWRLPFHAMAGSPVTAPEGADGTIWKAFQIAADANPDAPALTDGNLVLTYAQVRNRVLALARRIAAKVPSAAPIAILMPHAPGGMIAMLAGMAAGRVTLLVNPDQPADRIAMILADGHPGAIITPGIGIVAPAGCPMIDFDPAADVPPADFVAPDNLGPDAPALVVYTSGSSGRPKGIVQSQRAVLYRARRQGLAGESRRQERLMIFSPISALGGFLPAVEAMVAGACLLLVTQASPRETLELIEKQRVTVIKLLPRLLNVLLASPRASQAFRSVHTVRTGAGGALAADAAGWRAVLPPGCRLVHAYNQTEAGIAAWMIPEDFRTSQASLPSGYLDPSIEYTVLDAQGNAVPDGDIGELVVRGPHVALGEWQDGRCVAGNIRQDPREPELRIVRTGDLVRLRPDGLLDVIGRGDRMIKIMGNRVEPAEVEGALRRLPGIAEAAVEAHMQADIATLYAFVSGVDGCVPDRRAILASLRQQLPGYMVPGRLVTLPVLPKLANGKIDLVQMLNLANQAATSREVGHAA